VRKYDVKCRRCASNEQTLNELEVITRGHYSVAELDREPHHYVGAEAATL
jgi:hypothetical protein